jgi:spermidine synthase
LSSPLFEILAYEDTSLGPLCLRRRLTLSEPQQLVTEITLNHEFLMSSLHTNSERALAELSLAQVPGAGLRVLVGGLGLGYTAHAALASIRVAQVVVVEFLPPVIKWLHEGLVPLADELNVERRLSVVGGDVYARLLSAPTDPPFDVILIDVDHSPTDQLDPSSAAFYSPTGLSIASQHLRPGGVIALWSYEQHSPTLDAMRQTLADVSAHPVTYYNRHVHQEFTDWIYTGQRPLSWAAADHQLACDPVPHAQGTGIGDGSPRPLAISDPHKQTGSSDDSDDPEWRRRELNPQKKSPELTQRLALRIIARRRALQMRCISAACASTTALGATTSYRKS